MSLPSTLADKLGLFCPRCVIEAIHARGHHVYMSRLGTWSWTTASGAGQKTWTERKSLGLRTSSTHPCQAATWLALPLLPLPLRPWCTPGLLPVPVHALAQQCCVFCKRVCWKAVHCGDVFHSVDMNRLSGLQKDVEAQTSKIPAHIS